MGAHTSDLWKETALLAIDRAKELNVFKGGHGIQFIESSFCVGMKFPACRCCCKSSLTEMITPIRFPGPLAAGARHKGTPSRILRRDNHTPRLR